MDLAGMEERATGRADVGALSVGEDTAAAQKDSYGSVSG
jgi:hypothetical protein